MCWCAVCLFRAVPYVPACRKAPRKALAHTALSDIRESIEELKYYKKAVFKNPREVK